MHAHVNRCLNIDLYAITTWLATSASSCEYISDGVKNLKVLTEFWGFFEKKKVEKFIAYLCVKRLRDILMEKGYQLKISVCSLCVPKVAGLKTVFSDSQETAL